MFIVHVSEKSVRADKTARLETIVYLLSVTMSKCTLEDIFPSYIFWMFASSDLLGCRTSNLKLFKSIIKASRGTLYIIL